LKFTGRSPKTDRDATPYSAKRRLKTLWHTSALFLGPSPKDNMDFLIPAAHAQAAAPASPGGAFSMPLMLLVMFALMYFMLIRPQQKRMAEHRKLVESLGKGDEVLTNGGIAGRIEKVEGQFLVVEIATGVKVKMQRHAIANVLPKGSLDAAEKP
jgi:preprotein translocase subunit YajC